MARYMIFENAFLPDGFLHEASLDKPKVINTPDDMIPSLKWMPLDDEAKMALDLIAEEKTKLAVAAGTPEMIAKRQFKVKKMPPGADKVYLPSTSIADVKPRKAVTQEQLENRAFEQAAAAAAPGMAAAVAFAEASGSRASDAEPEPDPTIQHAQPSKAKK